MKDTVYALDSTTIDLCLSVFPWAPFRSTKAAVKLHTLLDPRGSIPSFIFISDGKFHEVNVLDHLVPEPGAFYVMDRAYIDFERLARLNDAGSFFVTRAESNLPAALLCGIVLQLDQRAPANQSVLRHYRERSEDANLIAVSVNVLVAILKKRLNCSTSLYEMLQILSLTMFERTPVNQLLSQQPRGSDDGVSTNQSSLFE